MEEVEDITSHGRVPPTPGAAEGLDPGGWRMTIETQTGMVMSYLAREIGIL